MKIINHHLGLPVISLDSSERAGDLIRFITDQVSGRIVAVAVSRKWYQEPHGALFEDCRAFGQNVVLISRMDALRPLSEMPEVGIHLEAANDARQRTAITEGGRLLGSVTDEGFDEESGEVTGYRLDVLADTGTSRTVYIPHSAFVTSSATVAILREDVLNHAAGSLEELQGGKRPDEAERSAESGGEAEETAPRDEGGLGAWPGATDVAYAPPAEVTEAPPLPEPKPPAPAPQPEPPAPEPEPEPPAEPLPTPPPAPPAAEEAAALPEEAETAADDITIAPEDFAPTTPDYEPDAHAADAVSAAGADAAGGHNRVMMALSLGRVAGATLHDQDGNVIVEKGETITLEIAQAAARADALYDLWTSATEN